jgi:hypothetical protein
MQARRQFIRDRDQSRIEPPGPQTLDETRAVVPRRRIEADMFLCEASHFGPIRTHLTALSATNMPTVTFGEIILINEAISR